MSRTEKPRKIIVTSNTSWYLYNFRLPLLEALVDRGWQVFALAPFDPYVSKLKKFGISHINISITRSGINPFADINLLRYFIQTYKQYNPDIVQHFTVKPVIYGTLAAQLCHIKYIYNMIPGMGYVFTGTSIKKSLVQKIVRFLYRNTIHFSHHVFFQNEDDHEYFLHHNLISPEKTSIVPGTGVNIEKFQPGVGEEKCNITFMVAARMLWDKGIGEFVEAARILREKYNNVDFWLLGPVDLQNPKSIKPEQLNQWSKDQLVSYLGMTDDIKSFYAKADVIVLPSYYKEGIPLSLLEGAAMGMPIISTDSTGCRDVIEDGKNGYLVPVRDVLKLASAMERFIVDPSKIKIMGEKSRQMAVTKFNSKIIVTQILKYYPI